MEKFTSLTGIAAPLLRANVNTDIIIRIERLMYVAKGQLGPHCFEAWRYRPDGSEDPDFVFNKPAYRGAKILLAAENFGCGSSREQAVWSLWDMGFRCVIAPSFGDIFYGNCFQNGMLPIVLPSDTIAELATEIEAATARQANRTEITVDLEQQLITTPAGRRLPFTTDEAKRHALLAGLDDIAMTQRREHDIVTFQAQDRARRPWIYRF